MVDMPALLRPDRSVHPIDVAAGDGNSDAEDVPETTILARLPTDG